jgi:uncharacterized protein (TIGR02646 family)
MKPVTKGPPPRRYSSYKDAKPDLIHQLGSHCSYCEVFGAPTFLDVEHIYPKHAHPRHKNDWDNFLIACPSCNSKKNSHLGSGRQRGLTKRFLWPHLDNTLRAFRYFSDGRVVPAASLARSHRKLASNTIEMVGFMVSPAKARAYSARSIAYTGASIREEVWREVESIRTDYLDRPSASRARFFANHAAKRGYFSIWMEVFRDRPEFRRELISSFKADPACFGRNTQTVPKGRV